MASHWVVVADGMKPCKVCGKTVSPNAKTCPHCGEPKPAAKPLDERGIIVASVVGFVLIMMIQSCVS